MDYSPPGSSVHGILQARILEWVATPFSRGSSWPSYWICVSHGKNHCYLPTSPLAKLFSMDFPWISSFKPHHSSLTWILFLYAFYREGNWGTEKQRHSGSSAWGLITRRSVPPPPPCSDSCREVLAGHWGREARALVQVLWKLSTPIWAFWHCQRIKFFIHLFQTLRVTLNKNIWCPW